MINQHLMEPFSSAYRRTALDGSDHHVVDEIVRSPSLSYRVGATLVGLGTRLMQRTPSERPQRAA